jgi:hypothetical protein
MAQNENNALIQKADSKTQMQVKKSVEFNVPVAQCCNNPCMTEDNLSA